MARILPDARQRRLALGPAVLILITHPKRPKNVFTSLAFCNQNHVACMRLGAGRV